MNAIHGLVDLQRVTKCYNIPTDPTGVPQNVIAGAASSTSITLRWEAPSADLQNGIIRSYNISVVELETGRVWLFTTNNVDRLLVVNQLHPFYTYNCTIAAYTVGPGPSSFVSVQTLPEGTCLFTECLNLKIHVYMQNIVIQGI